MKNQARISPAQLIQHILQLERKNKQTLQQFPLSPRNQWQTHVHNWKKQLRTNKFQNSPKLSGSPKVLSNQSTQAPPRIRKVDQVLDRAQEEQEQRRKVQELIRGLRGKLAESQSRQRKSAETEKENDRLRVRVKSLQDQNFELIRELGEKSILIWKFQNLNKSLPQTLPPSQSHSYSQTSLMARLKIKPQYQFSFLGERVKQWSSHKTQQLQVHRGRCQLSEIKLSEVLVSKFTNSAGVQCRIKNQVFQQIETAPFNLQKIQSRQEGTITISEVHSSSSQTDWLREGRRLEAVLTNSISIQRKVREQRYCWEKLQIILQPVKLTRLFQIQSQFQLGLSLHQPVLLTAYSLSQSVLPTKALGPRLALSRSPLTLRVGPSLSRKSMELVQLFSYSLTPNITLSNKFNFIQFSHNVIPFKQQVLSLSTQTLLLSTDTAVLTHSTLTQSSHVQTNLPLHSYQVLSPLTISNSIYTQTPLKEQDTQTSHSSTAQPEEEQMDFHWNFIKEVEQRIKTFGQTQLNQNVSIMVQPELHQVQAALSALINRQSLGRVNDPTCRNLLIQLQNILNQNTLRAAEVERLQSIFMAGVQSDKKLDIDQNLQWIFDKESEINVLEKQLQQQAILFKREYELLRNKLNQCLTLDQLKLVLQQPQKPFSPAYLDQQHKQQLRHLLLQYE